MIQANPLMHVDGWPLLLADSYYDAGRIAGVAILALIVIVFAVRKLAIARSKR